MASSGPVLFGTPSGLEGKRVLITGASAGIGRATALAFASHGACVVVSARGRARLEQLLQDMPQGRSHAVPADLGKAEECSRLVEEAVRLLGGLDVVVNNGGVGEVGPEQGPLDLAVWRHMMDMHVMSVVAITKAALPSLVSSQGCVVNVSSVASHLPTPNWEAYGVAKLAQDGVTQSLALTYAPQGVRINAVAPGAIDTDGIQAFFMRLGMHSLKLSEEELGLGAGPAQQGGEGGSSSPTAEQRLQQERAVAAGRDIMGGRHPLGRVGRPEEVAGAILFLASPAASFITGVVINVDGGASLTSSFSADSLQKEAALAGGSKGGK